MLEFFVFNQGMWCFVSFSEPPCLVFLLLSTVCK